MWRHFRNDEIEPASVRVPAGLDLVSVICDLAAQQGCWLGRLGNADPSTIVVRRIPKDVVRPVTLQATWRPINAIN